MFPPANMLSTAQSRSIGVEIFVASFLVVAPVNARLQGIPTKYHTRYTILTSLTKHYVRFNLGSRTPIYSL